jgi:outer membrane protein assembly factor BamB
LVFGPNGNLFVSSGAGTNNPTEVLEYNGTTGAFITAFATAPGGNVFGPQDLVFGPNGNLFVSSGGSNNVLEFNGTTGAFVTKFVTAGSGLEGPSFLVFTPTAVPEPSSLALLGLGCAALAARRRRRRNTA